MSQDQPRRIDQLLAEYAESHQDHTNKLIHWICIPLIIFSGAGLLWSIPVPFAAPAFVNWATVVMALVTLYYIVLSPSLAMGMLILLVGFAIAAHLVETRVGVPLWAVSLLIFAVAWVLQFVGHKVEKKKPSFLKDVQFLLIGPAWMMSSLYRRLGIPY